ncbi:MAG: hypothetical protein ACMVY4_16055 [Minwuia sp.]|uniref:hypothetical protein n=1 Tax=Minwuia sp. TaxID=2493630 RepID=UPI003A8AF6D4
MRTALMALTLLCALVGCSTASMDAAMSTWKGQSLDAAVAQWGYPDSESEIAGRHLYLWGHTTTVALPTTSTSTALVNGQLVTVETQKTTPVSSQCTRILEVNENDTIVGYDYRGDCCVMTIAGWCSTIARRSEGAE